MAGAKQRPNWQDKAMRMLESLQYREDFLIDIATLPLDGSEETTDAILDIINKYRLPHECGLAIYGFAATGNIDASMVISGMSVICDEDETAGPAGGASEASYNYIVRKRFAEPGVNIFIPVGARVTEVKSFIQSSWPYIEAKLAELNGGKKPKVVRRKSQAKRDARVMQLHSKKMPRREIKDAINEEFADDPKPVGYNDITKIIQRNSDI